MNIGFRFFPYPFGAKADKPAPVGHAFGAVTHATIALGEMVRAVADVFHPWDDQVDVDDDEDQNEG